MGYGNGSGAYAIGGGDAGQCATTRQSAVAGQTDELGQQVELLLQNVATLEKRLENVLQPSTPMSADKVGSVPTPHSVPFVRTLGELTMRVRGANQHLNDITQRIEV